MPLLNIDHNDQHDDALNNSSQLEDSLLNFDQENNSGEIPTTTDDYNTSQNNNSETIDDINPNLHRETNKDPQPKIPEEEPIFPFLSNTSETNDTENYFESTTESNYIFTHQDNNQEEKEEYEEYEDDEDENNPYEEHPDDYSLLENDEVAYEYHGEEDDGRRVVRHRGSASVGSSIFNLSNTILGGGVLALPFAMGISGILLGVFLLLFVGFLAFYSLLVLIRCISWTGKRSYRTVAKAALGNWGTIITDVSMFFACFGVCVAYIVLIGDLLPPVLHSLVDGPSTPESTMTWPWWTNRDFLKFLGMIVVTPLTLLRRMDHLRFTSVLAVFSVFYLVFIVFYRAVTNPFEIEKNTGPEKTGSDFYFDITGVVQTFSILSFAFSTHFNIYTIYRELKNPTTKRVRTMAGGSFGIVLIIYLLVGICGFFTFYENIKGNILTVYDEKDTLVQIGRVGLTITILFSYPLLAFPCKQIIDEIFFDSPTESSYRDYFIAIGIVLSSFILAVLIPDISEVFGITGGIFSSILCYILPGLFLLKLCPNRSKKWYHYDKVMGIILVGVGFCASLGTILAVLLSGGRKSA
eukprot:gb/GECH01006533.1/.p1 GENE.gb/GECH01006533.1/~~gb/GECH01006533.1/.p1  ORF type:complete len:580 (+),score=102.31 gb/GECH01006533.1/:1-1740(+)